jgi:uncharacterized protein (DUF1697 family)
MPKQEAARTERVGRARMNVYVALLRAINVGGSNLIKMSALKSCFETQGLCDVSTYIASGNVLFTAGREHREALTTRVESALSQTFSYSSRIVLRTRDEMQAIVDKAPKGFGAKPALYRYDVVFLKAPLTADEAMPSMTARPGVDLVVPGDGVLYTSRLIAKASQSQLSRIVGKPAYKNMTIRTWNVVKKLLELMTKI